jgi:hypothetical protein
VFVFVDDSGDAGFKLSQGSSEHLVIACCVFRSADDAELTADSIRLLRSNLKWHSDQEFKFSKTREDIRLQFFKAVRPFDFFVRSIVIDKNIITSQTFKTDRISFYNYAIQEVLTHSIGTIADAKVRVDGKGSREYVKAAGKYFKEQANSNTNVISSVKFVDSKGDQLIQLADMFAGAIRKAHDTEHNKQELYLDVLKPFTKRNSSDIWLFGK